MGDLLETFEDGVLTLTMNRPEVRNALNVPLAQSLNEAARRAADDPAVRCLVVTGAGGAFSAGGDINAFPSSDGDDAPSPTPLVPQVHTLRQAVEFSRLVHEMPKPTLAVIPGPAAGAGLSLALACDLRFCLDTAKLTTAFSRIGVSGDCGGSYFLPKIVGAAKARELYFTSEVITGREAYEIGLVTRVAGAESFEEESRAFARSLADLPTVAIGFIKKNLNAAEDATMSDTFDLEATHMALALETDDHKRALQAFVNREPAVFEGR